MILPDVRGLHPFYEELALRFAERGIDAVAIDWFGRTAANEPRGEGFDYMPARLGRRRGPASRPTSPRASPALRAADGDRAGATAVFTLGFCMGGRMSFLAGTLGLDLAGVDRVLRHARRAVAERRTGAGRRRRVDSHRRSSGCSAGRTRPSRPMRSRASMRPWTRPAPTTRSSPTRARRTASSTGRRPSSPTRAPTRGRRILAFIGARTAA